MPAKRKKLLPNRVPGLSAAAIEAWTAGDFHAVNREFSIAPWQVSPFEVNSATPPSWATGSEVWYRYWAKAWQLRQSLLALAGPPGKPDCNGNPAARSA